jgi:hypothetical protein
LQLAEHIEDPSAKRLPRLIEVNLSPARVG